MPRTETGIAFSRSVRPLELGQTCSVGNIDQEAPTSISGGSSHEHEAINVKIWDNIMILAGFLGLTDVVSKQFEKLYPRYTQETVYRGNTIFLSHHLARSIAQAKTSASSSSGSSGMGGGSSMGGGGGSFGGGSGGGTR